MLIHRDPKPNGIAMLSLSIPPTAILSFSTARNCYLRLTQTAQNCYLIIIRPPPKKEKTYDSNSVRYRIAIIYIFGVVTYNDKIAIWGGFRSQYHRQLVWFGIVII